MLEFLSTWTLQSAYYAAPSLLVFWLEYAAIRGIYMRPVLSWRGLVAANVLLLAMMPLAAELFGVERIAADTPETMLITLLTAAVCASLLIWLCRRLFPVNVSLGESGSTERIVNHHRVVRSADASIPITIAEDALFQRAYEETVAGSPDKATWARALAETDGDRDRATASYIRRRVASLQSNPASIDETHVSEEDRVGQQQSLADESAEPIETDARRTTAAGDQRRYATATEESAPSIGGRPPEVRRQFSLEELGMSTRLWIILGGMLVFLLVMELIGKSQSGASPSEDPELFQTRLRELTYEDRVEAIENEVKANRLGEARADAVMVQSVTNNWRGHSVSTAVARLFEERQVWWLRKVASDSRRVELHVYLDNGSRRRARGVFFLLDTVPCEEAEGQGALFAISMEQPLDPGRQQVLATDVDLAADHPLLGPATVSVCGTVVGVW